MLNGRLPSNSPFFGKSDQHQARRRTVRHQASKSVRSAVGHKNDFFVPLSERKNSLTKVTCAILGIGELATLVLCGSWEAIFIAMAGHRIGRLFMGKNRPAAIFRIRPANRRGVSPSSGTDTKDALSGGVPPDIGPRGRFRASCSGTADHQHDIADPRDEP